MTIYRGIPPHSGSPTSYAAAVSKIGTAETDRAQVLSFLRFMGRYGATDEEIQESAGLIQNTERPRRRELVLMGEVVDSGKVRRTRTGRKAIVWVVKTGQLRLL